MYWYIKLVSHKNLVCNWMYEWEWTALLENVSSTSFRLSHFFFIFSSSFLDFKKIGIHSALYFSYLWVSYSIRFIWFNNPLLYCNVFYSFLQLSILPILLLLLLLLDIRVCVCMSWFHVDLFIRRKYIVWHVDSKPQGLRRHVSWPLWLSFILCHSTHIFCCDFGRFSFDSSLAPAHLWAAHFTIPLDHPPFLQSSEFIGSISVPVRRGTKKIRIHRLVQFSSIWSSVNHPASWSSEVTHMDYLLKKRKKKKKKEEENQTKQRFDDADVEQTE